MALKLTVTTPQGFEAIDAYHRVEAVKIVGKTSINFELCSHKAADHPVAFEVASRVCGYDLDGDNPIKQAYEHLKTLPEFAGAADV